ncbi:MAG: MotA/TolQ/ExbB proton channel family protein [Woeseiaceae bacterium]|nr:MotA/TolQ/ExbB proton channel family protein [Woeseiaceae bacterium]
MDLFELPFISIRSFLEAGGTVLWVILFVTILLWTLIIERLFYFRTVVPKLTAECVREWTNRPEHVSWRARKIRDMMISEFRIGARRYLKIIHVLMVLLPLLGLLGTVTGMIQVFNVMSVAGTSNARLMAAGVSAATIPTMAGLVAALSGLFFVSMLQRRAEGQIKHLEDSLVVGDR